MNKPGYLKDAAQLGTFDMDLEQGVMELDERARRFFGINHRETVTYLKDFVPALHPDDREKITTIINNVFIKSVSNGNYDVAYRTVGIENQRIRWVRAKGKAYFNEQDKPVRFIGSVLDITEQKLDELRKNDFIAMVSHELKTPLTSLTAPIQVLNSKLKNSEDSFTSGALKNADKQLKKMGTMINGFLNISRLESGKIQIIKQEFLLDGLIREIVREAELTVSTHQIKFNPCLGVKVNADIDKIGSVISNLLSNAVKYSPKDTIIHVDCQVVDDYAQVSIRDEGIGINHNNKEKLFDRYYRVENTHTQHISGFGIGLYLSAEIINRHAGKIWVESEIGFGLTFYFNLPLNFNKILDAS